MKTFTLQEMITSLRDMAAQILTEESNGKALFNAIADELERIPPPMSNEFVAPGCEQFDPPLTYNELEQKFSDTNLELEALRVSCDRIEKAYQEASGKLEAAEQHNKLLANMLPQREQQLRQALERVKDLENYAKVESAKLTEAQLHHEGTFNELVETQQTLTTTMNKLAEIDLAELRAYVKEQARVADANSKEWYATDRVNAAHRSGMWYAYQDILNRLSPEAYKVTVPGKEIKE